MDRRLAEHLRIKLGRHRLLRQHQLGHLVAVHRELVEHLPAPKFGFVAHFGGNVRRRDFAALLSLAKVSIRIETRSISPRKASLRCGGPAPTGKLTGSACS